jgi:CubicO group peptidase (beta-lactamase class C family)
MLSTSSRRQWRLPILVAIAICPAAIRSAPAQPPSKAAIDRIFTTQIDRRGPGCAAGAVQDGRFVFKGAYGIANLDDDVPIGPNTLFYVGSESKQFTAAAIGLLALEGRLSLDDDIRRYLPEIPSYGSTITIRNLIHHTSGIRDLYGLMDLRGDRMADVFPDSEAIALLARQKGLAFEPGSRQSYSNSGYFLLGQIVRRVSGKPLREFADERIFRPLGMTSSHFHDDPGHVMKGRAMSYERSPSGEYRLAYLQNFDKVGAGGLYTMLDDIQKWDENYYTRKVGGAALRRLLDTRGVLTSGKELSYMFGQIAVNIRGLHAIEHGGAMMGYNAHFVRFPEQHFSAFVMCNGEWLDARTFAHNVAEAFLGSRMQPKAPQAPRRPEVATPEAALIITDTSSFLGAYSNADLGVTYHVIRASDGRMTLLLPSGEQLHFFAAGDDRFRTEWINVRFERAQANGPVGAFVVNAPRVGELRFVRHAR